MFGMPEGVITIQNLLLLALTLAALVTEVVALVDAVRTRPDAFTAAGKLTKNKWSVILGIAVVLGIISLPVGVLGIFGLVAVVAAAVYLVDVRPAVRQMRGRGSAGGSHMGPYGPW